MLFDWRSMTGDIHGGHVALYYQQSQSPSRSDGWKMDGFWSIYGYKTYKPTEFYEDRMGLEWDGTIVIIDILSGQEIQYDSIIHLGVARFNIQLSHKY